MYASQQTTQEEKYTSCYVVLAKKGTADAVFMSTKKAKKNGQISI